MLLHPASDVVHPNRILKQVNGLLLGNGSFAQQSSNLRHSAPIGPAGVLATGPTDSIDYLIVPYIG
jgi:hypothetical protein